MLQSFWQLKWAVVNDTQNSESISWLQIKLDLKFKLKLDLKFDFKCDLKFNLVTINSALRMVDLQHFEDFFVCKRQTLDVIITRILSLNLVKLKKNVCGEACTFMRFVFSCLSKLKTRCSRQLYLQKIHRAKNTFHFLFFEFRDAICSKMFINNWTHF